MTKLIALIVEDDTLFALPAWHRTIPLLEKRGLLVTHVAVLPSRVHQYGGILRALWYSSVFRAIDLLRIGLFAAFEKLRRRGDPGTWDEMAHTHGLVVQYFEHANTCEAQAFIRSSQCDILHLLAPVAVSPEILEIPRCGTIAHHSSVLPSCRGVFPYLWATMNADPIGHSFQQLTPDDPFAGPLLAQGEAPPDATRSMLRFNVWVARRYPETALDATQRLLARRSLPERVGVEASYHGLPARRDVRLFERQGGRISTWKDLRLTLSSRAARPALMPQMVDLSPSPCPAGGPAYRFPEVLPLRINTTGVPGKVIPMPPRRKAQED